MKSLQYIAPLVIALLVVLLLQVPGAQPEPDTRPHAGDVVKATLPNGLRVVIVRNRLAPVVATAVNYLVGSDEAPAGFPGMAHAQEHMMFRGSPGLSADQLANIGSAMGGNFNADTRESLTQYLYTVPSEDLDVALNIEALRMRGVNDTEADWDKERGAIEQEVAQDMSSPFYVLYARLRSLLFAGTVYAHDALGTRPSFDRTTAAMLKSFHDAWYAPNNAVLVIAGDVDPQAALASVRRLFGAIPRKALPARPALKLAPVKAASFTMPTDRPEATQIVALRMPGMNSPDFPALEVLADVLQSQRADLYNLVVQGKAMSAGFELDPLPRAGVAYAAASFPPGGDAAGIDRAMRAILQSVAKKGVPADLVAAAKLQERRETEAQKNSIAGLASVWSDAVALYGLPSPEADLARIDKVTVADVNRVARQYLDLSHAISVTMTPRPSGRPSAAAGFGGQENIALGEAKDVPLPPWAEAALKRLSPPAAAAHPVVSRLANGLTLIVQPETVSDTVSVYGHVRSRAATEEPRGKEGVSLLLDRLFDFGTGHLSRVAFQQALDRIGASEDAGTDFSLQVLSREFDPGVALLADNELHPALPEAEMKVIQPPLAQAVAARNRAPGYLAFHSLRAALYPATDPSLRQATGESVARLSRDDVLAYYHRVFRPDLTTIVVIGNITPEAARRTIEKYFGGWQATGPLPDTDLPVTPDNGAHIVSVPDASRVQDSVYLAQTLALKRSDPDYYALSLGDAVLGGGFYASRLSNDLRKNAGLVYSVSTDLEAGRTRSVYLVRYASDPQNVSKAAGMATGEIARMRDAPVPEGELIRAKALLLRQMPLAEADVADIARGLLSREDLNLPLDEPARAAQHYMLLTPADVQAAFRKWMRPGDLVRVVQGPAPL